MQQDQEINALECQIVLLETELNKIKSATDEVVEQNKNSKADIEKANLEIMNLKNTIDTLEGKLAACFIYTYYLSNTCTCLNINSFCSY